MACVKVLSLKLQGGNWSEMVMRWINGFISKALRGKSTYVSLQAGEQNFLALMVHSGAAASRRCGRMHTMLFVFTKSYKLKTMMDEF